MRSMTGFSSHSCMVGGVKTTIEIKSVNHRYLDVYIKTPKDLAALEAEIRQVVQKRIRRGKVSLAITCDNGTRDTVVLNKEVLASAIRSLKAVKKEYPFVGDIQISDILKVPSVFTISETKKTPRVALRSLLKEIEQALEKFIATREKEGAALEKDIRKRLQNIKVAASCVNQERNEFVKNSKRKMLDRIKALIDDVKVNEDRLMKEVAFLLEKVDISEELVRLRAHQSLFLSMLSKKEKFGKDLDFVTQEMNREVNTIASKAQDSKIAHHVIAIKSELEKIREQLQNIE